MRRSSSVIVAAFQGGGDDMDVVIKRILADDATVSGVNSYNVCRPLAQMVHYFWIALRLKEQQRETPPAFPFFFDIVVPTGAMGNIAAATMAKVRGCPIRRVVAACNANDFTYRAFERGDASTSPAMLKTASDAINIQLPYNFERCLYYALAGDAGLTVAIAEGHLGTSALLPRSARDALSVFGFRGVRIDDATTLREIRTVAVSTDFVPCPNTAVALAAARDLGLLDASTTVVLATAHAKKFQDVVEPVVGTERWRAYVGGEETTSPRVEVDTSSGGHLLFKRHLCDGSLGDAQARWEATVRALLDEPDWDAIIDVDVDEAFEDDGELSPKSTTTTKVLNGGAAFLKMHSSSQNQQTDEEEDPSTSQKTPTSVKAAPHLLLSGALLAAAAGAYVAARRR